MLPGKGKTGPTAQFQFMGKILGILHPPSYPLSIFLNWRFVQLPILSVA